MSNTNSKKTWPQYDILPQSVTSRTAFATSVMHSYVHQWACQLAYNPRYRPGLGLSDGEGVERYWSRTRKIIGICRSSGVRCSFEPGFNNVADPSNICSALGGYGFLTGSQLALLPIRGIIWVPGLFDAFTISTIELPSISCS
jgi:hypothetical protein